MRAVTVLAALGLPMVQAIVCDMLQGLHNEHVRRQKMDYNGSDPFFLPEANAKHTPRLAISGTVATVTVGGPPAVLHPTSADGLHYIDAIYVLDQTGQVIAGGTFGPLSGAPPTLEFDVPAGTTRMTPYEHCNKHGLFYGETVTVTQTTGLPAPCAPSTCFEVQENNATNQCLQLSKLAEDWERREGGAERRDSMKHRPFAVEDNGRMRITVGEGTITGDASLIHPQNFGDNTNIHYIEGIYATDQTGAVIALSFLGPSSSPVLEFDIPTTATTITPHIFCNKHGLHIGDPVTVTTASSKVAASCQLVQCLPNDEAGCTSLESYRAWFERRHQLDHQTRGVFYGSSTHHVPWLTLAKQGAATMANIVIGDESKYHPMSLDGHHYMESFYLVDQNNKVIAGSHIGPSSPSPVTTSFEVPRGVSQITPYTFCNKHGLFRGPTVFLNRPAVGSALCGLSECGEDFVGMDAQGSCSQLEEYKVEYIRRHGGGAAVHDPAGSAKHTPMLTLDQGKMKVTVGTGTVSGDDSKVHGQYNIDDSVKIHYIEGVYAEDQNGRVIALALLGPESAPELSFDVPEDVTSVTGFAYCNIHGLYQSDTLAVQGVSGVKRSCGLATCVAKPEMPCESLDSLKAAYERRHLFDYQSRAALHDPSNKHTPAAEFSMVDGRLVATVEIRDLGKETFHPQSASGVPHFIESIYLVDQSGRAFAGNQLTPTYGNRPTLEAVVPSGVTQVTPYMFCNKHGLWRGTTTYVKGAGSRTCGFSTCGVDMSGMVDGRCLVYDAIHAEMERRQGGPAIFDLTNQAKHSPVVTVVDNVATITVGLGTISGEESKVHHQFNPTDGVKSHFIEAAYAMDANGTIVAAGYLSPLVDPPAFTFDVPQGVGSLTPYIYCNIHGLFRGEAVPVQGDSRAEYSCSVGTCWPEAAGFATCDLLQTVPPANKRIQKFDFGTAEAAHEPDGKHTPHLSIEGNIGRVIMGKESLGWHPMVEDHYIDALWVQDQSGAVLAYTRIGPARSGPATLEFEIPFGSSVLTPYGHCNKHGYHRGAAQYYTGIPKLQGVLCAPAECHAGGLAETAPGCDTLTAIKEDYFRRAGTTGVVYDVSGQAKHTPVATPQASGKVRITIGTGTVTNDPTKAHLQYNVNDPVAVHFIENIWAEDQDGAVIAMNVLGPLDNPAVLEFDVPAGVTSVTPFSYCNIHGLFRGDAVTVTAGQTPKSCAVTSCFETGQSDSRQLSGGGAAAAGPPTPAPVRITPAPPTPAPVSRCTPSTVVDPQTGEAFSCVFVFGGQTPSLHWTVNGTRVVFGVESSGSGWVGLSFPADASLMVPADGVIGWVGANGEAVVDPYRLTDQNPRGVNVDAAVAQRIGLESAGLITSGGKQLLRVERRTCLGETGTTCVPFDPNQNQPINCAQHPTARAVETHPADAMAGLLLSLARGEGEVEKIDIKLRNEKRRLHGALMMAAWLYCAPVGIFFKRYGKPIFGIGMSTSHTFVGQGGFLLHLIPVLCAVALSAVSFDIALQYWWTWGTAGSRVAYSHSQIGTTIFLMVIVQPTIGLMGVLLFPQKDHVVRPAFNFIHGWIGRLLQILSAVQCFTGLKNLQDMYVEYEDLGIVAFVGLAFFCAMFFFAEILKNGYRLQRTRWGLGGDHGEVLLDFIGAEKVAAHDRWEDCWVIIGGFAYDVTEWLVRHPGGGSMIYEWAGVDATASFEGYRHSVQARNLLAAYRVAEVEAPRVQNSVELSQEIASALVLFDLQDASELVEDGETRDDMPKGLIVAFQGLIANLKSYKSFLPQSLIGAADDEEEEANKLATAMRTCTTENSGGDTGRKSADTLDHRKSKVVDHRKSMMTVDRRASRASYATSHRTGGSKATTAMTRDAQAVLKKQREKALAEKMQTVFKPKTCSLAVVNANGAMKMCKKAGPVAFGKALRAHLQYLLDSSKKMIGIVDNFQGDRMIVGFNTAAKNAQHKSLSAMWVLRVTKPRNASPVHDRVTPAFEKVPLSSPQEIETKDMAPVPEIIDITAACASATALCGNAGCDGMLRFTVMSYLYGWVNGLERLAGAWGVKAVADEGVMTEACAKVDSRILARVFWAKAGIKSKVSSLDKAIFVDEDEWMYQLQSASEKSLWAKYNKALTLYIDGETQEALQVADEALSSPPQIDGASHADLLNVSTLMGVLRSNISSKEFAPYVEMSDFSVTPSASEPSVTPGTHGRARASLLFTPTHMRES